tara:strand:- start:969 stop:1337 length:369 start_codon:yes stop_codon:yes gene_type:complete
MNKIQKRVLTFFFGCVVARLFLVILAYNTPKNYLPLLGYLAMIPAVGFLYNYLYSTRAKGFTGGKIWWNNLRPIHSFLYASFAFYAIQKNTGSFKILLLDLIIGKTATLFHYLQPKYLNQII